MDAALAGTDVDAQARDLSRPEFWAALAPQLHVGGLAPGVATAPGQSLERLSQRMRRDGYFGDRDQRLETVAPLIGQAVVACVERGLPPVFVWAYDEPWECFRWLAPVIGHFLGPDYRAQPAFWAWHVDPKRGDAGWRPHRDNVRSMSPGGAPRALTCWIPLSEANPLNGCMYIVPAHLDPHLTPGAAHNPPFPPARALPAEPGDYLIWNQLVLHWGGPTSEFAEAPRMSMALEFQSADIPAYKEPLLDAAAAPPFDARIRLIAQQILQYTHMYAYSEPLLQLARALRAA